jgi:hypothetical protein
MAQPQPKEQSSQHLAAQLFGGLVDRIKAIPGEVFHEVCHQVPAGSHEMAAALFNGSAFVMYQRGTKDDPAKERNGQEQGQHKDGGVHGQDHGQQQEHEHQQERGRSM